VAQVSPVWFFAGIVIASAFLTTLAWTMTRRY